MALDESNNSYSYYCIWLAEVQNLETASSGSFIKWSKCRKVLVYRSKLKLYSLDIFWFLSGILFPLTVVMCVSRNRQFLVDEMTSSHLKNADLRWADHRFFIFLFIYYGIKLQKYSKNWNNWFTKISDKHSTHLKQQIIAQNTKKKQKKDYTMKNSEFNLSTTAGMVDFLYRVVLHLGASSLFAFLRLRPCLACLEAGSIALWRSDFWMLWPKPRRRSTRLLTSEQSSSCSKASA